MKRLDRSPRLQSGPAHSGRRDGTQAGTQQIECAPRCPLSICFRPVASLTPNARNARVHTPKHVAQIAASIQAFGFNVPLLVDADGHVIAGHGRLLAAQHLGWSEVPTIGLEHLTPDQVRAFAVADNRLSEISTWDEQLLAEQLKYLAEAELDFDISAIGFELPEIDLRIQSLSIDEEEEAPPASEETLPVVTSLGNALDRSAYDALLGTDRAAMVITDPPFNVPISGHVCGNGKIQHREFEMAVGEMSREQFTTFLSDALSHMKQHSVDGALVYVSMDWRHALEMITAAESQGLEQKNLCVWAKGCGGMGSLYRSEHELVFVFKAGEGKHANNVQLGRFGRNRTNVWNFAGVNSFARDSAEGNLLALHPTCKPVPMIAEAILDASDRGECVLDPFLGSGTTLIAAERTGRIGLGMELDPLYVDVAVRRWQRLTGQAAVHAATGQAFDHIAQSRIDAVSGIDVPTEVEVRP
jgi:DNA modification methylase